MDMAKVYANALFSLSSENKNAQEVLDNLKICRDVFKEYPEYFKITDTPSIITDEKIGLIDNAFSGIDETVLNTMKILCEKHSLHIFPEVVKEYIAIYNEANGICDAEVISAVELSETQLETITNKLQKMLGKTVKLKMTVDKEVLGGIKLRYMGKQLDGTLKSRLETIENGLKNTVL